MKEKEQPNLRIEDFGIEFKIIDIVTNIFCNLQR